MTEYFQQALDWLNTHPSAAKPIHHTTRTFGFELPDGRQLAIKPLKTQITAFAEPGDWEGKLPIEWKLVHYAPEKTRSSNLLNCAPRLAEGNAAVCLALTNYADFERFMRIYASGG